MKKVMFLGAAKFQMPAIEYANSQGYYSITLDNRLNNPGHKIASKSYCDISTIDKEAVLKIAKQENIDGILSFGSDIAAATAAFVSEEMNLLGNTQKSIEVLTNKSLFRSFLSDNSLQEDVSHFEVTLTSYVDCLSKLNFINSQFIVKPIDSAGSKGVGVFSSAEEGKVLVEKAIEQSIAKRAIIESFKVKKGYQICGDGFFSNEKIDFIHFGNGHFYDPEISLAPYAETFPSNHSSSILGKVKEKLEKILNISGFRKGVFNFDVLIDEMNNPFVIEIGPRSGGNYIPTAIKLCTGVDLIEACVESALDPSYNLKVKDVRNELYACYMIHSEKKVRFQGLEFSSKLQEKLIQENIYLQRGDVLEPFHNASHVAGNIILKFDDYNSMIDTVENLDKEYSLLSGEDI